MNPDDFTDWLAQLDGQRIAQVAEAVCEGAATVDGEIGWWRATVAVHDRLCIERRRRDGGRVARAASRAVVDAAERAGLGEDQRDVVIRVARAAGEAARSLVPDVSWEARAALFGPFGIDAVHEGASAIDVDVQVEVEQRLVPAGVAQDVLDIRQ